MLKKNPDSFKQKNYIDYWLNKTSWIFIQMTVYESLRSKLNFKNMNSCKLHKISDSNFTIEPGQKVSILQFITDPRIISCSQCRSGYSGLSIFIEGCRVEGCNVARVSTCCRKKTTPNKQSILFESQSTKQFSDNTWNTPARRKSCYTLYIYVFYLSLIGLMLIQTTESRRHYIS